jgi:HPt (histidine-containing phosphotransfer) domain-containing protein
MLTPFIIDKAAILERLGGDEEIYAMMLEMFLNDVAGNSAALRTAAASGQAAQLQREAHTLKGLLATFSDDAGSALAYALEQQARRGQVVDGEAQVTALLARIDEVAAVLRQASGR